MTKQELKEVREKAYKLLNDAIENKGMVDAKLLCSLVSDVEGLTYSLEQKAV